MSKTVDSLLTLLTLMTLVTGCGAVTKVSSTAGSSSTTQTITSHASGQTILASLKPISNFAATMNVGTGKYVLNTQYTYASANNYRTISNKLVMIHVGKMAYVHTTQWYGNQQNSFDVYPSLLAQVQGLLHITAIQILNKGTDVVDGLTCHVFDIVGGKANGYGPMDRVSIYLPKRVMLKLQVGIHTSKTAAPKLTNISETFTITKLGQIKPFTIPTGA